METHSDTTTIDGPTTIENIPDQNNGSEDASFFDAIEQALTGASEDQPQLEAPPEPEAQPEAQPEQEAQPESKETETKSEDSTPDPLESLTEDVGEEWTPKAATRFKQLKTELKTNRSELEQLQQAVKEKEQQISEMKGLSENEDFSQMKEKLAEFERQQSFNDLENTEAYKTAVSEPLEAVFDTLNILAEKYEVDPDNILDALDTESIEEQDEKISDIFHGASDRDKVKIFRAIEEIEPILEKREELHKNAEEALGEAKLLEEEKSNAIAAEELKHRQAVTQNVIDRVSEKLPFLKGIEGVDMEAIKEKAYAESPNVIHPVDFAYNSVAAQLLPTLIKEYFQTVKENDSLTDRLADYETAEPNMSGQVSGSSAAKNNLDFASAIEAALSGN